MYKEINSCRICDNTDLVDVFALGDQALTGVFPRVGGGEVPSGPVDLVMCAGEDSCGLVQLRQSYEPSIMYGDNYGYRSGLNKSMEQHLQRKVASILKRKILKKGDLVIDIGSNDGTTLRAYPQEEYQLVGVDPTGNKFKTFYPNGVVLLADFFSSQLLRRHSITKKAKVITSFSMFYDLEDPVGFAKEVSAALHEDGIWITEQSYLPAMMRTTSFDTICHEHLEYYCLSQINLIAGLAGLRVLDVEFNDINGGSFSVAMVHNKSSLPSDEHSIQKILGDEDRFGYLVPPAFDKFKEQVERACSELRAFLEKAHDDGKLICGLGASTKGNVLLQYLGGASKLIDCIAEVNPDKFGAHTPGTSIPILPQEQVLAERPDYLVVLPWHFRGFFEKNPELEGYTLVFPLPELSIHTVDRSG